MIFMAFSLWVSIGASAEPSLKCDVSKYVNAKTESCGIVVLSNSHSFQVGVGTCSDLAMAIMYYQSVWTISAGRGVSIRGGIDMSKESTDVDFRGNPPAQFEIDAHFPDGNSAYFKCETQNWIF